MIIDVVLLKLKFCLGCGMECCRGGSFEFDILEFYFLVNYKVFGYIVYYEIIC